MEVHVKDILKIYWKEYIRNGFGHRLFQVWVSSSTQAGNSRPS